VSAVSTRNETTVKQNSFVRVQINQLAVPSQQQTLATDCDTIPTAEPSRNLFQLENLGYTDCENVRSTNLVRFKQNLYLLNCSTQSFIWILSQQSFKWVVVGNSFIGNCNPCEKRLGRTICPFDLIASVEVGPSVEQTSCIRLMCEQLDKGDDYSSDPMANVHEAKANSTS